ncbi:nucleoside phosphorylase domain-containing protein [Nemania sp. FL0031]|nr:nucleoside phosphorylase domain-containing protein [Nemania sp. FL0031]
MTTPHRRIGATEYTVGWICALPVELAASIAFLGELYLPPPRPPHDLSTYQFGRIGSHNVVLACLPSGATGTSPAATVAAHVRSTFPTIQFGLLVGIGGGAPCSGDVVVSKPIAKSGGVIQYDFGKTIENGKFIQTGSLNKPPAALLSALSNFDSECQLKGNSLTKAVLDVPAQHTALRSGAVYPGAEYDKLFKAEYDHEKDSEMCASCNPRYLVNRSPRLSNDPLIHFGLIASGNQVMRHGVTRERLQRELGVLCFEMEAAGLMDNFPCLVVRGICDYADSHKNKKWHSYAAVTSAACAKKIVQLIPSIGAKVITAEPQTAPSKPSFPLALENSFFRNRRNPRFSGRDTELSAIDS